MTIKLSGLKISGKHTTVIDAAEAVVKAASKLPEVKKISLGIIRCSQTGGRSPRNIKIKDTDAGLEIMVRGSSYVQTIWIYLVNPKEDRHNVASRLAEEFG
jgi:hypothetical protein